MNIHTEQLIPFRELKCGQLFRIENNRDEVCLKVTSPTHSKINAVNLTLNCAFEFDEEEKVVSMLL